MKKLILLVISCVFIFSCDDREVETESNFGFTIESGFSQNINVKTNSKLDLEIVPSKLVEDVEYFISYKVLDGDLALKNKDMESLPQEISLGIGSLDSLKTNYYIYSDQIGASSMLINYSDNYGGHYADTLSFSVNSSDLSLSLTPNYSKIYLGGTLNLNFEFSQNQEKDIDYSLKYLLIEGDGIIKNYSDDEVFEEDKLIEITEGRYRHTFETTELGEVVIRYIIVDEFGEEYPIETSISVVEPTFEIELFPVYGQEKLTFKMGESLVLDMKVILTGYPDGSVQYVNYDNRILFSEEVGASGGVYVDTSNLLDDSKTFKYIINNSVEGVIKHEGPSFFITLKEVSNHITYYLELIGSTLSPENNEFTFSPSELGPGTFEIEVIDPNGLRKTDSINYNVVK